MCILGGKENMIAKSLFCPQLHARNKSVFHLIIFISDPLTQSQYQREQKSNNSSLNHSELEHGGGGKTTVVIGGCVGESFSTSCSSSSVLHLVSNIHLRYRHLRTFSASSASSMTTHAATPLLLRESE
ncbi:uncharacterized protein G2W53_018534 [Senna tora]|uniref:Uncharacterized protein n=1 Tax=Senna tora TaxID=362788 RepID=A0A834TRZ4_9FABA|nr:uncharacterized protein G2W53_018534 [Senna tora]